MSYLSRVTNFNLRHPRFWRLRWGWLCLNFTEIFGIRKLESLRYRVALIPHYLRDPILAISVDHPLVTTEDRHTTTAYNATSMASRGNETSL